MKPIPADIYNIDLNNFFWKLMIEFKGDEEQSNRLELLRQIIACRLTSVNDNRQLIGKYKLDDEQVAIIREEGWDESENIQVKNRCRDVLIQTLKGDRREYIKNLSKSYFDEYCKTNDVECVIRAIDLLAYIRQKQVGLIDNISSIVERVHWRWVQRMIKPLNELYKVEDLQPLVETLNSRRKKEHESEEFDKERGTIRCLNSLKQISDDECHKDLALCYKWEVEKNERNAEPNTIYPYNVQVIAEGYKEIYAVKDKYPDLFLDIQNFYNRVKQEWVNNLRMCGVKMRYSVSEDEIAMIEKMLSGYSSQEVITQIIGLPFVGEANLKEIIGNRVRSSILEYFAKTAKLDDEGNTVGVSEGDTAMTHSVLMLFRHRVRLFLELAIDYVICLDDDSLNEWFVGLLDVYRPSYINENTKSFWERGLLAGLRRDWQTAVFFLTPCIENALHNYAEEKNGVDITNLHKELQHEPTLGKDLDLLKGYIPEGTRTELQSFLNDSSGLNFRNIVAHGLVRDYDIHAWGIYLWWIALKLYFKKF
jgi:hypothetical protein